MRCDIHISIRNYRVEGNKVQIKNVIGSANVEKACTTEIIRQADKLLGGEKVLYETRKYDPILD